ncbi:hypothetical protein [Shewanella surugensis]|uniref:Peptidase C-terminal archaeal/bacterial domain-containing protein n=1 Tax=Shewanella surugensis TaxID=212020 RepID=A0ABT0LHJ0_9GAMM|nr:hypothetical protein [Shewanella surugensis]MCL1127158.1 hypothetical protein [Shewanella surugensis]
MLYYKKSLLFIALLSSFTSSANPLMDSRSNKTDLSLSTTSFPVNVNPSSNLTSVPQALLPAEQISASIFKTKNLQSDNTISPLAYTPLCTTLNTGVLYTLNSTQTGGTYCYHFTIAERAKTTAILVNQDTLTDFTLSVYQDIDGTIYNLGTSSNAANTDEVIKVITEPGEYYWYMQALSATNATINFGAEVTTNIDQYEVNDTYATRTYLADMRNFVRGNHESANDLDYYVYQASSNTNIDLMLNDVENPNQWIFESLDTNGVWQPLLTGAGTANNQNVTTGQIVDVRVRPNLAITQDPNKHYRLSLGTSAPQYYQYNMGTFSGSVALQQRVDQSFTVTPGSDYEDLISAVVIPNISGSISGMNCDLDLYNQYNQKFASYKCSASKQYNLPTNAIIKPGKVTAKMSIYHASFSDPSTRSFSIPVTLSFGSPLDLDSDSLPYWFEAKNGLSDENPDDALLDSDNDGFSNLAEFNANTSPVDANSHP